MASKSYDTYTGNAPDVYGNAIVFETITKQVDITAWGNNLEISASYDNANFEGDIEIPAGSRLPTPLACRAIKVRNHTAGQVARYEIVAWYEPTLYV